jgi:putative oxidoreductase
MLPARAMLAYIFIHGAGAIADYAGTVGYMQTNGVDARLLPLVILTELGGGLLVLFGLKVRWAAIAFCGFSLLTAFLIHLRANEMIGLQKNVAMAGGSLALAVFGPGAWSFDRRRGREALRTLGRYPKEAGVDRMRALSRGRGLLSINWRAVPTSC